MFIEKWVDSEHFMHSRKTMKNERWNAVYEKPKVLIDVQNNFPRMFFVHLKPKNFLYFVYTLFILTICNKAESIGASNTHTKLNQHISVVMGVAKFSTQFAQWSVKNMGDRDKINETILFCCTCACHVKVCACGWVKVCPDYSTSIISTHPKYKAMNKI